MARLGCGGNLCVHSGLSPYMVHSLFITHWPGWDTLALDVTLVVSNFLIVLLQSLTIMHQDNLVQNKEE